MREQVALGRGWEWRNYEGRFRDRISASASVFLLSAGFSPVVVVTSRYKVLHNLKRPVEIGTYKLFRTVGHGQHYRVVIEITNATREPNASRGIFIIFIFSIVRFYR